MYRVTLEMRDLSEGGSRAMDAMALAGMNAIKQAIVGMSGLRPTECMDADDRLDPRGLFGDNLGVCLMIEWSAKNEQHMWMINLSFWTDAINPGWRGCWDTSISGVVVTKADVERLSD